MGSPCELVHIVQLAAAEIHVGEHEHRDPVIQLSQQLSARNHLDLRPFAEQFRQTLGHVEVGGKVLLLGEDERTVGTQSKGGGEELEHVDGGGIGHRHLVLVGADQRGDACRHSGRELDPPGGVPGPDQLAAPLGADGMLQAFLDAGEGRPQGVAVEVDHTLGKGEAPAQIRQPIGGIQLEGCGAGGGQTHGPILAHGGRDLHWRLRSVVSAPGRWRTTTAPAIRMRLSSRLVERS